MRDVAGAWLEPMSRRLSNKPPLIGIVAGTADSPEITISRTVLADAVADAGGCPMILPHGRPESAATYLDVCDGLLLPGGGDFSPAFFGGPESDPRLRRLDPRRDIFEAALAREADRREMPVLGICKGMQWMAVARGGSLYIDLEDDFPGATQHSVQGAARHSPAHDVILDPGSRLAGIAEGTHLAVNSRHHQAVAVPGRQVRVAGTAPDGVIEAIEWADRDFAIGLQWHPEDHAAVGDTFSKRLFSTFVDASAASAAGCALATRK